MKATVLNFSKSNSKYGGYFYYMFFKGDNEKSYRSCISSTCRNYSNWSEIIDRNMIGAELDNLKIITKKGKEVIDADSKPIILNKEAFNDG